MIVIGHIKTCYAKDHKLLSVVYTYITDTCVI